MTHPLLVTRQLADMNMDMVCLQTGLLHDVVEDTSATLEEVRKEFGDEVARCVDGVTKLSKLDLASREERQAESVRKMAGQRTLGLNAIRSNPNIVGYSLTGMNDHVSCGEGLTTTFRELKPGTVDAMFEGFAPLRLCLFAEPVNVYRGARIRFEAALANEDALAPGEYPVRLLVVGPQNQRIFEKTANLSITNARRWTTASPESLPSAFTISGRRRFSSSTSVPKHRS